LGINPIVLKIYQNGLKKFGITSAFCKTIHINKKYNKKRMFNKLEPLLLSQARMSIMGLLYHNKEMEFISIQKITEISPGNLSIQINKLRDAGFLEMSKSFKGNYPSTNCVILPKGVIAFEDFIDAVNSYLKP
jgi:DNA-binding transcriptional ArsR family regulator